MVITILFETFVMCACASPLSIDEHLVHVSPVHYSQAEPLTLQYESFQFAIAIAEVRRASTSTRQPARVGKAPRALPSHCSALSVQVGAKDKKRAEDRRGFGLQLLRGLGMWALSACAFRYVPQLLQSVDWGALLLGAA